MVTDDTLIFVDGENIYLRYLELVKLGRKPRPDTVVVNECFVWNNRILQQDELWKVKRLSYYTSVVGDDDLVRDTKEKISGVTYECHLDYEYRNDGKQVLSSHTGQIMPFVRKKSSKSRKESICDISISVDVMRSCYRDHARNIWIFSGDGDFLKLFEEVVHSGKTAYAAAFSSGLHPDIRFAVDEFFLLDDLFFEPAALADPAK